MDVIKILEKNKKKIEKEYSVGKIGVFGSYAKGIQTESSDIDILVEFKIPTYDNFINLAYYLEDLYGKRIDLVTVKGLSPYIYPFIEKEVIWC
jgi:predicted nucleotidyltransferase